MSIKNILGNLSLLDNKSLNIVCNSIKANDIEGKIETNDIETDNLIVNSYTELSGSVFPNSPGAEGKVLEMATGNNLIYTDLANNRTIQTGVHTPVVNSSPNINVLGVNQFSYQIVGEILTWGGEIGLTCPSSGSTFYIDLTIPSGAQYDLDGSQHGINGTGGSFVDPTRPTVQLINVSGTASLKTIRLTFARSNNTSFLSAQDIAVHINGILKLTKL